MSEVEDTVVEVWMGDRWSSYSRCTKAQARAFLNAKNDVSKWRAVDWITFEPVLLTEGPRNGRTVDEVAFDLDEERFGPQDHDLKEKD